MPVYAYECVACKLPFETYRQVAQRDDVQCPLCGVVAGRKFLPTANIQTPEHFRLRRGWHEPTTTAEWESLERNIDKLKVEKEEDYRDFVERKLAADRRITLAGDRGSFDNTQVQSIAGQPDPTP